MIAAQLALLLLACLACSVSAKVLQPFVGGNQPIAVDSIHACMLLIERADLAPSDQLALGSGSIVSRSRVLTAAHVVRGATGVMAGFYRWFVEPGQIQRADAIYVQPIKIFEDPSLENDLAIVIFNNNVFPALNVIRIAGTTPTAGAAFVAGYGFVSPTSTDASLVPLLAPLTVAAACSEDVAATPSHFCAATDAPAILCPGDNGAGIFVDNGSGVELVGVASLLYPGCTVASAEVGFTSLTDERVVAFLLSQSITVLESDDGTDTEGGGDTEE